MVGAAADQGDGLVARHLQPLHQAQGHEVAHVQAVRRAVKADIERGLAVVHQFPDLLLIGDLGNESPGLQFFVNTAYCCLSFSMFDSGQR